MNVVIPVLVWWLSAAICLAIAKHRKLKPSAVWAVTVALFGPIVIPLLLLARAEKLDHV